MRPDGSVSGSEQASDEPIVSFASAAAGNP
jgi:hypothetical protein